ncbi:hypothetical protein [Mycolicibacterium llatzerense]|uniref:Uncharacterized protein n=1 Tax=Mycolicibacterium llatzerense TaxID=280871 RepID=A0A0D1J1R5_9MYCO|nr:hypothetical protein [Mycolicibacterium llatzerense]KIU15483.1 hypothetical protein TL10_18325 [Mycolicibacterium llatzerense]
MKMLLPHRHRAATTQTQPTIDSVAADQPTRAPAGANTTTPDNTKRRRPCPIHWPRLLQGKYPYFHGEHEKLFREALMEREMYRL